MNRTPLWVKALVLLFTLPVLATPTLLAMCPSGLPMAKGLVWVYPFYMLLSALLAWRSWPGRSYLTWLMLAMMALSTAAMWMLVNI